MQIFIAFHLSRCALTFMCFFSASRSTAPGHKWEMEQDETDTNDDWRQKFHEAYHHPETHLKAMALLHGSKLADASDKNPPTAQVEPGHCRRCAYMDANKNEHVLIMYAFKDDHDVGCDFRGVDPFSFYGTAPSAESDGSDEQGTKEKAKEGS